MHVDRRHRRELEQPAREDLPIGDDDEEVGTESFEQRPVFLGADSIRLMDEESLGDRVTFHRRSGRTLAAPSWAVRLREDSGDFVPACDERFERPQSELRGPQEDHAHRAAYQSPALAIFRILLRIRLRLRTPRRSMKSTPLRWSTS